MGWEFIRLPLHAIDTDNDCTSDSATTTDTSYSFTIVNDDPIAADLALVTDSATQLSGNLQGNDLVGATWLMPLLMLRQRER